MDKIYRILVINPGSTSTKLSMFENETCLFTEDVFHDSSVLKKFPTINAYTCHCFFHSFLEPPAFL